jgi:excinuclease ABC subunit C
LPSKSQSGKPESAYTSATWQSILFNSNDPKVALAQLPEAPALFALFGIDAHAEPYVGRTPNLKSRLTRLLQPSAKHPRRLHLAGLVSRIEWRLTGSEFESLLLQFNLLHQIHGTKSVERMHLRHPAFVRFLGANPYPRLIVTHRLSQRDADWAYGPFASRASAERYVDEMLKLFLLRRCIDDLHPDPSHPGCVYSEMKMCLAPCFKGCSDERYAEEAVAVERFLASRGESRLVPLRAQRDEASSQLEFESAAALHVQVQRVEGVRTLAPELVKPMSKLRALILQASAQPGEVAVFLFENGVLRGPARFSTIGMRIQNEHSGSTSLFAQPLSLEPVPDEQGTETEGAHEHGSKGAAAKTGSPRTMLEARLEAAIAELSATASGPNPTQRQGYLALLKRWYYRPEVKRIGEIFFPDGEELWPLKSILRGIGRVAAQGLKSSIAAP